MAVKIGQLLANLAKKLNIDTTSDEWKEVVGIGVELDDDNAGKLEKGLMTVEAAKSHKDVRNALRAETLNGLDSTLSDLVEELGIEVDDDFKAEKNSFTKVGKLARKIKEVEAKKAGAGSKVDKEGYDKQLVDLNQQLKAAKQALTDKEKEWNQTRENDLTTFDIHKLLLGKNYALPKEMDPELKISTAFAAVNKELGQKGFQILRTETGLKMVNKDGQPAFTETNDPVEVASFIDGTLARNKLLVTNDQGQGGQSGNNGQQQVTIPGGGQAQSNAAIVADIDAQIASFQ